MSAAIEPRRSSWRFLFLIPLALFAVVAGFLALGLTRDPGVLPSALVGRAAPQFSLAPLPGHGEAPLTTADLAHGPVLVNIFASWCVPCRIEHPQLMRLKAQGVTILGIDYKDKPAEALALLKDMGDPYAKIGSDADGRVGIEWGAYGVPETYVIDPQGRVAYRQVGPIEPRDLERTILPLLDRLKS